MVLAESEEAANHIFDQQIGDVLSKFGPNLVHEIHITDQRAYNNFPLWMKVTLNIDSSEERMKETNRLVKLLCYMVDRVVTLRLSAANKAKADKSRKAADKLRQKEKAEETEDVKLQKKRE